MKKKNCVLLTENVKKLWVKYLLDINTGERMWVIKTGELSTFILFQLKYERDGDMPRRRISIIKWVSWTHPKFWFNSLITIYIFWEDTLLSFNWDKM